MINKLLAAGAIAALAFAVSPADAARVKAGCSGDNLGKTETMIENMADGEGKITAQKEIAAAQDAMRAHAVKATMAILIATALHAIATGNMLPAFVTEADGTLRELATICVDSSEFVVSKLKDRGTHQAFGVVTNAQDFMHILRLYVERELDARGGGLTRPAAPSAAATGVGR